MSDDSDHDQVSALVGRYRAVVSPLRAFLKDLHTRYRPLREGKLADYIPELTKAVSSAGAPGRVAAAGGLQEP